MIDNFKYKTNWCIITGAPSSGKTSVIEELAHRGYAIQNEIAREVIEMHLETGKDLDEIRNKPISLQKKIMEIALAREMALDIDKLIFMDRGIPDNIAYFELAEFDCMAAKASAKLFEYKKVFIFDRLPIVKDNVRIEDEMLADKIDATLTKNYKELGYKPIRVPVMSIEKRTDFIIEALKQDAE